MNRTLNTRRKTTLLIAITCALALFAFAASACSSGSSSSSSASASGSGSGTTESYTVPNVVSLTQSDAEKSILSSGLQLGNVTFEASSSVPLGSVVSQNPKALTAAPANSKVDIVVSSGPESAKNATVPNLYGMSQADAKKALENVGLVGVPSNPEVTTEVQPGQVFKQSVAAGTSVPAGSSVAFTVAIAPAQVSVPNVVGQMQADAKTAIEHVQLGFDYTVAYNDSVEKGRVISQSVAPGTRAQAGTIVTVTVSLGAAPTENVEVPNVVGYSWSDAEKAVRSAGLAVRYTGDPAGIMVSQDIAAGTQVAKNTLVTVSLSQPKQTVEVPNLIGMSVTSAEAATDNLNLVLDTSGATHGTITDQWPAAGTIVDERTTVNVTVDASDFGWTSASSASDAASKAGLSSFDVMDSVTVGGVTFSQPAFSATKGAAEARYMADGKTLYIRSSDSNSTSLLTDYNEGDFAYRWTQNHKGLEITCFGDTDGAAQVIAWSVANQPFAITYQGQGGTTATLAPDDITSLVSGIQ